MTLKERTTLGLIAGLAGGIIGWAAIEAPPFFRALLMAQSAMAQGSAMWWEQELMVGLYGLILGVFLGAADSLGVDGDIRKRETILAGAACGAAGGMLGVLIGQTVWAICGPSGAMQADENTNPLVFLWSALARGVGWACIGAGIGSAQGVARRSAKLIKQGAFGGFVGGLIGGIAFQAAGKVIQSPSFSRLLGFAAIGAAVGLLIGLVQDLFKQAWVRVLVGKNEGKEYLISNSVTTIGRSELCDIPLFGDPAIAPNHAAIEVDEAGGYILRVVAKMEPGVASVIVNGQVVSSAMGLANGDTIQLSKKQVEFHERMSRVRPADLQMSGTPVRSAPVDAIPAGSAVPHERDLGGRRLIWLDRNQPFILGSNGKFTIGRSLDRDIAIADSSVSRLHATIVAHAGVHSVSDEGSANGTSINGMPLPPRQSRELLPGDILGVGNAMLRYE